MPKVTGGAVVERPTAALCVAGSIPAQSVRESNLRNYLYDLHLVIPGLAVCACEFKYV